MCKVLQKFEETGIGCIDWFWYHLWREAHCMNTQANRSIISKNSFAARRGVLNSCIETILGQDYLLVFCLLFSSCVSTLQASHSGIRLYHRVAPRLNVDDPGAVFVIKACCSETLGIQVPPQKVFEPSKPSPNTFSEGTWIPRDQLCFSVGFRHLYKGIPLGRMYIGIS